MNRKNLPVILLSILLVMLLVMYLFKNNLNDFISKKMQQSNETETIISGQQWVDSLFNYTKNKEDFEFTILQFKSGGCTICKQMEPELKTIKNDRNLKVNITTLNVLNPNSQNVMKYFGISAVPTHLILNKEGIETFRQYGYISAGEMKQHLVRKN